MHFFFLFLHFMSDINAWTVCLASHLLKAAVNPDTYGIITSLSNDLHSFDTEHTHTQHFTEQILFNS